MIQNAHTRKAMDAFDIFTSEPSTTKATSSSEIENTHEIANDGSSWLIENVRKFKNSQRIS